MRDVVHFSEKTRSRISWYWIYTFEKIPKVAFSLKKYIYNSK